MGKMVRKAVRCYVIKDNKVLVIRYKENNLKFGYYDIPGGKIENGETPEETAIREVKEETGINIRGLKCKGIMKIEYPNRIFVFDVFTTNEFKGTPQEFEENSSEWIDIKELLNKEKLLATTLILKQPYIKNLIDNKANFNIKIYVSEKEEILDVKSNIE